VHGTTPCMQNRCYLSCMNGDHRTIRRRRTTGVRSQCLGVKVFVYDSRYTCKYRLSCARTTISILRGLIRPKAPCMSQSGDVAGGSTLTGPFDWRRMLLRIILPCLANLARCLPSVEAEGRFKGRTDGNSEGR